MLRVESVHKSFLREGGSIPALLDVTLDLEAGQFGTLIGPSGCGKTTLLRIIAGLIPPSGGTVYVDGQPTVATGATRQFHTPELPVGQAYFYDMKAVVEVGGRKVVEEMKVVVGGGGSVTRSFGQLLAAAGGADRQVASK